VKRTEGLRFPTRAIFRSHFSLQYKPKIWSRFSPENMRISSRYAGHRGERLSTLPETFKSDHRMILEFYLKPVNFVELAEYIKVYLGGKRNSA